MYRHIKSSHVLASVMVMTLWVPCSTALADEGRYNNPGHQDSPGWNDHHEGYHRYNAPYHASYNQGHHQGHFTHYYPPQPSCGTCSQKNQHHHNNNNHHWWHFW
jgi:hypothetical protein